MRPSPAFCHEGAGRAVTLADRLRRPGSVQMVAVWLLAATVCALIGQRDGMAPGFREWAGDRMLALARPAPGDRVVVVEIDDATLAAVGPWPWPRDHIAALVTRIAGAAPQVIGVDMLLAGPDRYFDHARRNRQVAADGSALPDPDAALAQALQGVPVVLGALLDVMPAAAVPQMVPLIVSEPPPRLLPWTAPGAVWPHGPLLAAARGAGIASLAGSGDAMVREVPLLVTAQGSAVPGFAAEVLRVADAAPFHALSAAGGWGAVARMQVGTHGVPLDRHATLRFHATPQADWSARSVSALAVLTGGVPPERFAGRIVLLGGSAPQMGGLRATAAGPVTPSVQIQADALATMLSGQVPLRPAYAWLLELVAFASLIAVSLRLGQTLGPVPALGGALLAAAVWMATAAALCAGFGHLTDPVTPALAGLAVAGGTVIVMAVRSRRLAASIRRRFEQHLSPAVVARIAENPQQLRLKGERREVTVMFTDIEGFTEATARLEPEALVDLLDRYFAGVIGVVVAHGGMVDKIVGDAVYALFNAPLDLDDHATHAVRCAAGILEFTRGFALLPDVAAAGLGRTRIGIETGLVVVGDVGHGEKLDYTAYGTAINTASRLEGMNKTFGTSICVGAGCRAQARGIAFRHIALADIRGLGPLDVYEPDFTGVA